MTELGILHSAIAYLVLAGLLLTVIIMLIKWLARKPFSKSDKTLALITLIFSHTQLVLGLILYFAGPKGIAFFNSDAVMKDPAMRLYAVEHIAINIIAIALITIGYSKSKRSENGRRKLGLLWGFYLPALVLILSRIPWQDWMN